MYFVVYWFDMKKNDKIWVRVGVLVMDISGNGGKVYRVCVLGGYRWFFLNLDEFVKNWLCKLGWCYVSIGGWLLLEVRVLGELGMCDVRL